MSDPYKSQRAMRALRKTAMQRGVVAVLDVGTTKMACLVLRFDPDAAMPREEGIGVLAGQAGFRVIGAATTRSRGVRRGEICEMQETERAIRTVVQAAQKMAGVRVDHALVCFSGGAPRSYGLAGAVDLTGEAVSENDVARVLAACEMPAIGEGREVLHAQPVNFAVDHRSGLTDPRGQAGNRLSTDMHLVTVEARALANIAHCLQRCDMELAGVVSSAYAAGVSALVEDEQELGAACIDMGGGTTSISIFVRKHMIYADCVPIGGQHVTSDISLGLHVPMATAERIKTFYGGVIATGRDDREMIELTGETGDWERDRRSVSVADVIGIMRPRLEEILEEVQARLEAAGFDLLPARQIVLTGGGSLVPGLDGLAQRILGQQVRLGRPLRVRGLPQLATGPAFSAAVGLSLQAAHPQDECWDFALPIDRYPVRSLRRAVRWLRDNW